MGALKGKRALVTAGGQGLGFSIAAHLLEAGCNVAVHYFSSQIPLGRPGAPADVARAVAFLASEYDGFITGATLDINGGVYAA